MLNLPLFSQRENLLSLSLFRLEMKKVRGFLSPDPIHLDSVSPKLNLGNNFSLGLSWPWKVGMG